MPAPLGNVHRIAPFHRCDGARAPQPGPDPLVTSQPDKSGKKDGFGPQTSSRKGRSGVCERGSPNGNPVTASQTINATTH